jgi:hypothetical protein
LLQDYKASEEGITSFKLDLDSNTSTPQMYSQVQDENVEFQKGQFIDQYTMVFNTSNSTNLSKNEQAIVNVKFSPAMFTEIVKFEVKLNSVPESSKNREVLVNWKMYDGFDPKGEFFTDSNELEMKKRVID